MTAAPLSPLQLATLKGTAGGRVEAYPRRHAQPAGSEVSYAYLKYVTSSMGAPGRAVTQSLQSLITRGLVEPLEMRSNAQRQLQMVPAVPTAAGRELLEGLGDGQG